MGMSSSVCRWPVGLTGKRILICPRSTADPPEHRAASSPNATSCARCISIMGSRPAFTDLNLELRAPQRGLRTTNPGSARRVGQKRRSCHRQEHRKRVGRRAGEHKNAKPVVAGSASPVDKLMVRPQSSLSASPPVWTQPSLCSSASPSPRTPV